MTISVIILTYNSAATIAATVNSACRISDDVHVVDSYSDDETCAIAEAAGARVVQHPFEQYGLQRNWAIENLPLAHPWELHLDADERLSEALIARLQALGGRFPDDVDGYALPRLVHFMGRPLRHGGMYPIWHLRLFRRGKGRCETRRYDQHFHVDGRCERLRAPFIDDIRLELSEWVSRHNRWAEAEVEQILDGDDAGVLVRGRLRGSPLERQRARRLLYDRLPPLLRPFLLFFYRYVVRLGFLDGREGLVFHVMQGLWFRFLIDAKLLERRLAAAGERERA